MRWCIVAFVILILPLGRQVEPSQPLFHLLHVLLGGSACPRPSCWRLSLGWSLFFMHLILILISNPKRSLWPVSRLRGAKLLSKCGGRPRIYWSTRSSHVFPIVVMCGHVLQGRHHIVHCRSQWTWCISHHPCIWRRSSRMRRSPVWVEIVMARLRRNALEAMRRRRRRCLVIVVAMSRRCWGNGPVPSSHGRAISVGRRRCCPHLRMRRY